MSSEPKTFASLGPTLLARKGGAKPAMRPQVAPLNGMAGQAAQAVAVDPDELEDLGWNDMGHDEDHDPLTHDAQVFALTPMKAGDDAEAGLVEDEEEEESFDAVEPFETAEPFEAPEPVVHRQQRELVNAIVARPRRVANDEARRAAFTLRLDAKRHLKLRLASTVKNRSAQQLVTQALDQFLASIPEIEALAAQVKRDR
jgi:hypothetical protein